MHASPTLLANANTASLSRVVIDNNEGPDAGPEALVMDGVEITLPNGSPAACWDLHIGAKVSVLGRKLSLLQASRETLEWLEEHGRRLTKLKDAYLDDLAKYQQKALPNAIVWKKGPMVRGGASLRSLVDQIGEILALISKFRPVFVQKETEKMHAMGYSWGNVQEASA